MSTLKKKELEMRVKKAEAAIAELEFKIEEKLNDIKRMEDHIGLQKELVESSKEELAKLS